MDTFVKRESFLVFLVFFLFFLIFYLGSKDHFAMHGDKKKELAKIEKVNYQNNSDGIPIPEITLNSGEKVKLEAQSVLLPRETQYKGEIMALYGQLANLGIGRTIHHEPFFSFNLDSEGRPGLSEPIMLGKEVYELWTVKGKDGQPKKKLVKPVDFQTKIGNKNVHVLGHTLMFVPRSKVTGNFLTVTSNDGLLKGEVTKEKPNNNKDTLVTPLILEMN